MGKPPDLFPQPLEFLLYCLDNRCMDSYLDPAVPWRATIWPISRRIVLLPPQAGQRLVAVTSELKKLRNYYSSFLEAVAARDPAVRQLDAAAAVLRPGFSKRAIGRLCAIANQGFGRQAPLILSGLQRASAHKNFPKPYTFDAITWVAKSSNRTRRGDFSDDFFFHPRIDHHDLLAFRGRPVSLKDFQLGFEEESEGGRKEARQRWDSAARAYEAVMTRIDRANDARDSQIAATAELVRLWAPDAGPEIEVACWMARIRDRFSSDAEYRASPNFLSQAFWFYFLHSELNIKFPEDQPDVAGWVEALVRSPKKAWEGGGPLEGFRKELAQGFDSFGGHYLALFRAGLLPKVRPRKNEGTWIRPLFALAALCAEALAQPGFVGGAALYLSRISPVTGYNLHGLVSALQFGVYIPHDFDPATPQEKDAWRVQRECSGWDGNGAEFSEEEFDDPPAYEDIAQQIWRYCPQPVHPDSNLVEVPVADASEFEGEYSSLGAPLGIIKTGSIRSALLFYASMDPTSRSSVPHEDFGGIKWAKLKRGGMRIIVREVADGFVWNAYARKDYHRGVAGSGQN